MTTTILRGARCPFVAARLAAQAQSYSRSSRYLSVSTVALKLPTRNWGAAAPRGAPAPARDWGAAKPPARDWGAARPPPRTGNSGGNSGAPRNNANNDRGDRPPRRQRDDDDEPGLSGLLRQTGVPRQSWGKRDGGDGGTGGGGGDRARRQSWGVRDQGAARGGPRGAARGGGGNKWGGLASTPAADPAPAVQHTDRSAEIDQLANSRPKYGGDAVDSFNDSANADAGRRGWEDEDRGRRRRELHERERESRSLLHTAEGDYLPSSRHHSDKGRGKAGKGGKGAAAGGAKGNQRSWVVEDDEAMVAAREEYLRQEADKARKAAEKRKKEAQAKKNKVYVEKDVFIPQTISVAQLAEKFGIKVIWLMRKMVQIGMEKHQTRADYLLNSDDASNLAIEYNLNPIIDTEKAFDIYPEPESEADLAKCPLRPPVVTIMGHVDHGKTTLLDSLRRTSVAAGEAGGITQHIAAFSVPLNSILPAGAPQTDATITFLDTPGHAAFTGMRARGASVTDLVVLVVAADDGVMPQTKEVLELVKSAGDSVGLVVAINKCDKPMIDVDRVKSGLGSEGIILEEDGGEVPSVRVSGLTRMGLDDLVETLSTLAEIRDLRARETGKAEGYVLESHVDKGQGVVSTVLVSRGVLKTGSAIVAGQTWARVRTMFDSTGSEISSAGPGTPVTVTGWRDVPVAGDQMLEAINGEDEAKKAIDNRKRDAERKALAIDSEQINARREEDRIRAAAEAEDIKTAKEAGKNITHLLHAQRRAADSAKDTGKKELRLVVKGDVSGTVEAVEGSLSPIGNAEAGVKIIYTGVGDVNESDIMLAEASDAMVVGFNVECPRSILSLANMSGVPIHVDSVIYRLIDSVRGRVAGLLPPKVEYRITGEAVVQQVFEIKLGRKEVNVIAGCKVGNGIISRSEGVRVLRGPDREVVYEGTIETLKQFKKDVTEIRKGTECGIGLANFSTIKAGDEIVTFNRVEVPRTL